MKAYFKKETKERIVNRDYNMCILCYDKPHSVHHIWFWIQANRWKNRNDEDQWVTLCFKCHNRVHWCASWEWARQDCIDYINNLEEYND